MDAQWFEIVQLLLFSRLTLLALIVALRVGTTFPLMHSQCCFPGVFSTVEGSSHQHFSMHSLAAVVVDVVVDVVVVVVVGVVAVVDVVVVAVAVDSTMDTGLN